MNKLITIAVLGLAMSAGTMANDRIGDFSDVKPMMGESYGGQSLGRNDAPVTVPTFSGSGIVESGSSDRTSPNA